MGPESKTDKSLEHGQSLPQTSILSSREDCSSWDLKQRRQLFRTGAKLLEDAPLQSYVAEPVPNFLKVINLLKLMTENC